MLSSVHTLDVLRATAESTRLRIVTLLQRGELSVSDLTDILGQSQPRISRHLKLLTDAGIVEKHREGTWVYFSLVGDGPVRELVDAVLAHTDPLDRQVVTDLERLEVVRNQRIQAAHDYFSRIAEDWDEVRSLHAPDAIVERSLLATLNGQPYRSVLDVGTGTGRMLHLLSDHAAANDRPLDRIAGLDNSHSMLAVARANLDRAKIRGVELRQGDIYSPPFEPGSFDLVVIHQVLHFLDDPARAVREAAQLVAPGGRLLIVDFAPHNLRFLQAEHAHRRLGFTNETVVEWLEAGPVTVTTTDLIAPPADAQLTVAVWLAEKQEAAVPR